MALHDLGTLRGNESLTKPRCANTPVSATSKLADTSGYSTEERLLVSVWVHERQLTGQTMNQVVTVFQPAGNNKRQSDRASL
jgi:hypothetical protein